MASHAILQWARGEPFEQMLATTRQRHAEYCARFGIHHVVAARDGGPANDRSLYWRKVELLIDTIACYDHVLWIDADCVICADEFNLFDASRFGVAVTEVWDSPSGMRYINAGVVYCSRSPAVCQFLLDWNAHPGNDHWHDNAALIALMATRPNRDLLTILPNRFNWVEHHQEARDPFIRSFHGDSLRLEKIDALCKGPRP